MIKASEEATKTWIRDKGLLICQKRQKPSVNFGLCLVIGISLSLGFVSGFAAAGFILKHNFSSLYYSLVLELEIARTCFEHER